MEVLDLRGFDSIGTLMVLRELGYKFEVVEPEDVASEKEDS